jgi:hypothetical protein
MIAPAKVFLALSIAAVVLVITPRPVMRGGFMRGGQFIHRRPKAVQ